MKFYFAGATMVGKTTLVNSLFDCFPTQWNFWSKSKKPPSYKAKKESMRIVEEQKQRTIGLDVHLTKAGAEHYFLLYDLGGQECFYTLHSLMIDCRDSTFFVVFNLENILDDLKAEIDVQLKIVRSHHSTGGRPRIAFIGTHLDCVTLQKMKSAEELIKGEILHEFDIETVCITFVDARKSSSSEIIDLFRTMKDIACQVLRNMVSIK